MKNKALVYLIIGGVILAAIIVFGSLWMRSAAGKDTRSVIRSLNSMYLEELAVRREQVVEKNLNENVKLIDIAVGLMTAEDLRDTGHLMAYQSRMKKLFKLERFAFVNTSGHIYTSTGVKYDIDEYPFDYKTIKGPQVAVKNVATTHKTVVIAKPVDKEIAVSGDRLTVCFMEQDMSVLLEGASMDTHDTESTFCNIYTREGIPLSELVLGGKASETNLLNALANADFEQGYSYEQTVQDFQGGKKGMIAFSYKGTREMLAFVPVKGTDWQLTYLVRESVVSSRIGSVFNTVIARSLVQSVASAVLLLILFGIIITQMGRNVRLTMEKASADLIMALSRNYKSVFYVDLDNDTAACYREDSVLTDTPRLNQVVSYRHAVTTYSARHVAPEDRDKFNEFVEPDAVRTNVANNNLSLRYLEMTPSGERYTMLKIAGVSHGPGSSGIVCMGFSDVDEETRQSLLQQQALQTALDTAEEASKAKTTFLSSMSHEIRTPMNAIIGLDSLALRNKDLPEETRDYLTKIGSSAKHLLGLINDILDMSRIESGRLTLRSEEFSFRDTLEQINTMVMSQCSDKGLEYTCQMLGGVSDYYIGDNMKLKQVLINILSNAVKFTDAPGSIRFTVERRETNQNHSVLVFTIKDTGAGMDQDFVDHELFKPFTQAEAGKNSKYGSTGLGMAITQTIVTLMNGEIHVDSKKGVGTTFTVTITLKNADSNHVVSGYLDLADMRVLIVDDEEVSAEHARMVLEEVSIKADVSYNGPDALRMVEVAHTKQQPYNLVLLDWKMPEMDGLQVAEQIRSRYDSETTVIILTSYNWEEIYDQALHVGVDSFLAKPLFASNIISEFETIARKNNMQLRRERPKAELKGRHILLAEDILINAEIMTELLEIREVQVDHAENGEEALALFENHPSGYYSAILMDIQMPRMDGLEAARAIRASLHEDARSIPIIALTANAFDEDVQKSLQAGMNAHLSKPVEPETLFETLETLIVD
ncbi:MAG: response regulator [Abditibacteriota bacterium]|nr:response regulator [Abditibacteriota bacterium]